MIFRKDHNECNTLTLCTITQINNHSYNKKDLRFRRTWRLLDTWHQCRGAVLQQGRLPVHFQEAKNYVRDEDWVR